MKLKDVDNLLGVTQLEGGSAEILSDSKAHAHHLPESQSEVVIIYIQTLFFSFLKKYS